MREMRRGAGHVVLVLAFSSKKRKQRRNLD